MSSPDTPERDLVDELLTVEPPTGADRIRPLLMAETTSVVRRRRWTRQLGVITALAGCYLAGIATTQAWRYSPRQPDGSVAAQRVLPADKPGGPESPIAPHEPPVRRPDAPAAAVAQTDFDEARRAGDRHLREEGDILSALDSYSRALDRASPEDLAISGDEDSWLMMAIKQARTEENRNGNHGT